MSCHRQSILRWDKDADEIVLSCDDHYSVRPTCGYAKVLSYPPGVADVLMADFAHRQGHAWQAVGEEM